MVGSAVAKMTRRTVVAGAAGAVVTSARADPPPWLDSMRALPGFRPWKTPQRTSERLLAASVTTATGTLTVREWLGGRPAVVDAWATWCPPCMSEKRSQAALSAYLTRTGMQTQIKALQAFDNASFRQARERLDQLGAQSLESGRASERAEQALLYLLGLERDRRSTNRASSYIDTVGAYLPFALLVGADGALLGQMIGAIHSADGKSYWVDPATVDVLRAVEQGPSA